MANSAHNIPIFVVDDEPAIRETLEGVLSDEGYVVSSFPDASSFFKTLETQKPSLVLLDIWLPGTDGMAVLGQLRRIHPEIPVIMMSGHAGIESAVNAIKMGAADFLEKPLHLDVLVDKFAELLHHSKRLKEPAVAEARPVEPLNHDEIKIGAAELVASGRYQCTLRDNVVLNGTGLLTGRKTGIIVSPLGPNSGIVFQDLDGTVIPGHITALESLAPGTVSRAFSANSTVLVHNSHIRTVEHLMASLSMAGITNALVKADYEIPNIDGSAIDFCRLIKEAGRSEALGHPYIYVTTEDFLRHFGLKDLSELPPLPFDINEEPVDYRSVLPEEQVSTVEEPGGEATIA